MQIVDFPNMYVSENQTVIDQVELAELRIDAYTWRTYQESLRKHGVRDGICVNCGGTGMYLCGHV
jgi:hypothetical protein